MIGAARRAAFVVAVALSGVAFALPMLTYLQIDGRPATVRRFGRAWTRTGLWLGRALLGVGWRAAGRERRAAGPALIAANHQTAWETVAFLLVEPDVCVVAKRELGRIPVFGWYARRSGMILIDRAATGSNLRHLLREAKAAAAEGRSVLIFPEGGRVAPGERRAFERGLAPLYRALGLPLQPAAHNSGVFLAPSGARARRAGVVTLEYLDPIPAGEDPQAAFAAAEAAISAAAARLAADP